MPHSPSTPATAESPDSPKTSPAAPPRVPTSSLFLPPKGPAAIPPPPSPSSSTPGPDAMTSSPQDDAGEAPTWSADSADSEATSDPSADSSTPSTGKAPTVSRAGLRAVLGQAVKTVTNAIAVIAADATEREYGLWRADPDDVDGVAAPVSRIVWRRLPEEARDSDTLDLFGLGLAVAAYVAKNLRFKAELRHAVATGSITPADQRPIDEPAGYVAAAGAP